MLQGHEVPGLWGAAGGHILLVPSPGAWLPLQALTVGSDWEQGAGSPCSHHLSPPSAHPGDKMEIFLF